MLRFTALMLAVVFPVSTAMAADPSLLGLVMPGAKVVTGIEVSQSQASPFGQYVLSQMDLGANFDKLATAIGFDPRRDLQEVIAAAVYVGVEMAGPGHVRHHGRGDLVIGQSKSSADIARALIAAGVPTDITDNMRGVLWAKLITNCAYNALSAITQLPYGRLVEGEGVTVVLRGLVDECLAVAKADDAIVSGAKARR